MQDLSGNAPKDEDDQQKRRPETARPPNLILEMPHLFNTGVNVYSPELPLYGERTENPCSQEQAFAERLHPWHESWVTTHGTSFTSDIGPGCHQLTTQTHPHILRNNVSHIL